MLFCRRLLVMRLTKRVRITIIAATAAFVFLSAFVLPQYFPVCRYAFGRKGNLLLTMKTYQHTVRMNGSIDVILTLRNLGLEEAGFGYSNSHVMDLFLYSLDGKLVTYFTKGCGFLQVLSGFKLAPGEAKEWRISWNRFSETGVTIAGPYLLEGSVLYFGTDRLPILILP